MATITQSVVVESVAHGSTKRNLYRYTLDNGETFTQRGWIAADADDAADMAMRGQLLLNGLVQAEITGILG